MSVQNNLQKPTFTKSVMGYTPNEVDRYVDHVGERYNSVCRENAELKRRVIALTSRLDEAETKLAEAEKNSVTKKILDKSALREVFSTLEDEKTRYACFIESLMDRLNSMVVLDAPTENETDTDDEWEEVLESFIEEAIPEDTEENINSDGIEDTELVEEPDPLMSETAHEEKTAEKASAEETEAARLQAKSVPEAKKTPAEIAAELDFYTDDVHRDGESFDPMTLAAHVTSLKRKPTFADFMNPLPTDNGKDKNK